MAAYTLIVTRTLGSLLVCGVFAASTAVAGPSPQVPPPPPPPPAQTSPSTSAPQPSNVPDEGEVPDEDDTDRKPTEYHFNPLRAKKELDTGMFYWHKGSYRAAAGRFLEATRWNPSWAEAYFRLGEAQAKLKHKDDAKKSFAKVMQLDPQSKEAKEAKKQIAKL
jgi:hypothetical protein